MQLEQKQMHVWTGWNQPAVPTEACTLCSGAPRQKLCDRDPVTPGKEEPGSGLQASL